MDTDAGGLAKLRGKIGKFSSFVLSFSVKREANSPARLAKGEVASPGMVASLGWP